MAFILALALGLAACAPAAADDPRSQTPRLQTEIPPAAARFAEAIEAQAISGQSTLSQEYAASPRPSRSKAALRSFSFTGELTQGGFIIGTVPRGAVSARLGDTALTIDRQGRFFAAFDRDAAIQDVLSATLADGSEVRADLAVSPRSWNIQHINAPLRGGVSSARFRERRAPELARIGQARTVEADAAGWSQAFIWPVTGRISGHFGRQRVYRGQPGSYHSGIDIAVPTGTIFVAPAAGVVTLASREEFTLEGQIIIVDHGAGLNSAFIHLSDILVEEGERVAQGQPLGRIGATGRATGPHLHWSLKWRDTRLDPYLFTGPMP